MKKEAQFITEHNSSEKIAKSIIPDNTGDIETKIENQKIKTHIKRENIGSLRSTCDDYIKNLIVASKIIQ